MQAGAQALSTARWIATLMYVLALVALQLVGRLAAAPVELDATTMAVLAYALLGVGVLDYGLSLFLERKLLAKAHASAGDASSAVVSAAIIVSALGVSLAVYGLVLTLLGAPGWGAVLYRLCAVHGLHLIIRWPGYASAAEAARP